MSRRCQNCSALLGLADTACQFCKTVFDPNAVPGATPTSPNNYIPPKHRPNSAPPAPDLSKISDPAERRATKLITAVLCVLLICLIAGAGVYALHLKRTNEINQASWQANHQRIAAEEQSREAANAARFQQQRAAEQQIARQQTLRRAEQRLVIPPNASNEPWQQPQYTGPDPISEPSPPDLTNEKAIADAACERCYAASAKFDEIAKSVEQLMGAFPEGCGSARNSGPWDCAPTSERLFGLMEDQVNVMKACEPDIERFYPRDPTGTPAQGAERLLNSYRAALR